MPDIIFCFGTVDGKTASKGHMGDSEKFLFYNINDKGDMNFEKEVINPAKNADEKGHSSDVKMKIILEKIAEVDVIVANVLSPNFMNIDKKTAIQPVVMKGGDADEIGVVLSRNFEEVYSSCERRKKGEKALGVLKYD